jgi:hypothetical protein
VVPAENLQALVKGIVRFSEMTEEELTAMGKKGKHYLINGLSYEALTAGLYKKLVEIRSIAQKN